MSRASPMDPNPQALASNKKREWMVLSESEEDAASAAKKTDSLPSSQCKKRKLIDAVDLSRGEVQLGVSGLGRGEPGGRAPGDWRRGDEVRSSDGLEAGDVSLMSLLEPNRSACEVVELEDNNICAVNSSHGASSPLNLHGRGTQTPVRAWSTAKARRCTGLKAGGVSLEGLLEPRKLTCDVIELEESEESGRVSRSPALLQDVRQQISTKAHLPQSVGGADDQGDSDDDDDSLTSLDGATFREDLCKIESEKTSSKRRKATRRNIKERKEAEAIAAESKYAASFHRLANIMKCYYKSLEALTAPARKDAISQEVARPVRTTSAVTGQGGKVNALGEVAARREKRSEKQKGMDSFNAWCGEKEEKKKKEEEEEAEKQDVERRVAEKKEAGKKEAGKTEAEKKEAEKKEAEKREAEKKEAEKKEAEKKEAERKEAEKKEAERKEAEKREAEREEAEKQEAEKIEAEKNEIRRKMTEDLNEVERLEERNRVMEAEKKAMEREESWRRESLAAVKNTHKKLSHKAQQEKLFWEEHQRRYEERTRQEEAWREERSRVQEQSRGPVQAPYHNSARNTTGPPWKMYGGPPLTYMQPPRVQTPYEQYLDEMFRNAYQSIVFPHR
ncbi:MAG: hypothetical protein Q9183_003809 [Haloplaca sp. 2 TL-2023]